MILHLWGFHSFWSVSLQIKSTSCIWAFEIPVGISVFFSRRLTHFQPLPIWSSWVLWFFSLVIELIFISFCCFSHLQSPCSKVRIRTHKSLLPLACKTYFRCMHNPILLNMENNGPFLAFPLVLTKFSQTYQTLLHIEIVNSLEITKQQKSNHQIQRFYWP